MPPEEMAEQGRQFLNNLVTCSSSLNRCLGDRDNRLPQAPGGCSQWTHGDRSHNLRRHTSLRSASCSPPCHCSTWSTPRPPPPSPPPSRPWARCPRAAPPSPSQTCWVTPWPPRWHAVSWSMCLHWSHYYCSSSHHVSYLPGAAVGKTTAGVRGKRKRACHRHYQGQAGRLHQFYQPPLQVLS